MRFQKIFSNGKVNNARLYEQLKVLDAKVFFGCGDEFKNNRDWWVIEHANKIIAYCGCWYRDGVCMFCRAWVQQDYRGRGLHHRMINIRINAAKKINHTPITYTTVNNFKSANNLIKHGFLIYQPSYKYAGDDVIYFKKTF
jgi:GNAT superfamily N-acetyltransferase